jgi:multiple antibiotic resistance protein
MMELFISAFVTLFVVIDPPGCAPIYASLTSGASIAQRRSMAIRAVGIAAAILLVFALWGKQLLGVLGIELDSFRIAGGIMLFMIAMDMVFEKRTQRREDRAQKIAETPEVEDVSVFPMAMPMIAGPGSIATVMLLMSRAEGMVDRLVVLVAKIEAVITRLLGVLLAALAAQFVIDGLKASF